MSELVVFLVLTAFISVVHVSVTRTADRKDGLPREARRYFISAAGGMLLLGLIIEAIAQLFQY